MSSLAPLSCIRTTSVVAESSPGLRSESTASRPVRNSENPLPRARNFTWPSVCPSFASNRSGKRPYSPTICGLTPAAVPFAVLAKVGVFFERLAAGSTATPLTASVCGEPASLSFTSSVAVNVPAAFGLNVITIPQLFPIARPVPQVLVSVNAVASVPVKPMLVIARAAVPELVSVMLGAVFVDPTVVELKLSVCADSFATGAGVTPVPCNVTACGEPNALSAKLNHVLSAPIAAGLKITVTVQEAPAATLVPHVFVWTNELA